MIKKLLVSFIMVAGLIGVMMPKVALADCGGAKTSVIHCEAGDGKGGEGIYSLLGIVLQILTYGVGVAGTLGIVISGYQYLTAKDDMSKVMKAKTRLLQVVIGLVLYGVMFGLLNFLIPGGIKL